MMTTTTRTRWAVDDYRKLIDVWHAVSNKDGTVKDVAETLNLTRAQVLSRKQTLLRKDVELPELKRMSTVAGSLAGVENDASGTASERVTST